MGKKNESILPADTAYASTTLRGMERQLEKNLSYLKKLMLVSVDRDGPIKKVGEINDRNLLAIVEDVDDVIVFIHPIHGENETFVDFRPFVNRAGQIKNTIEAGMLAERAAFEMEWIESKEGFQASAPFIIEVFADWFTNGLAKRVNLDLKATSWLRIYAGLYAYGQIFQPDLSRPRDAEKEKERVLKVLTRSLQAPTPNIEQALDHTEEFDYSWVSIISHPSNEVPFPSNLKMLTGLMTASDVFGDIDFRLELLSAALVGGSFLGTHNKELVLASMESMPNFIYMMYKSLAKGYYGKTRIGQSTLGKARRWKPSAFEKYCDSIVQSIKTS